MWLHLFLCIPAKHSQKIERRKIENGKEKTFYCVCVCMCMILTKTLFSCVWNICPVLSSFEREGCFICFRSNVRKTKTKQPTLFPPVWTPGKHFNWGPSSVIFQFPAVQCSLHLLWDAHLTWLLSASSFCACASSFPSLSLWLWNTRSVWAEKVISLFRTRLDASTK